MFSTDGRRYQDAASLMVYGAERRSPTRIVGVNTSGFRFIDHADCKGKVSDRRRWCRFWVAIDSFKTHVGTCILQFRRGGAIDDGTDVLGEHG